MRDEFLWFSWPDKKEHKKRYGIIVLKYSMGKKGRHLIWKVLIDNQMLEKQIHVWINILGFMKIKLLCKAVPYF